MAFCTRCGHKNEDDARFCEECGAPFKVAKEPAPAVAPSSVPAAGPVPAAPVPVQAPVATPANRARRIKISAIAAVALLAVGTGAFFLLAPESPSNERFAKAIEKALAADSSAYKARYCLSNFPYDRDPVHVNDQDQGTRRWLSVLTKAGLYSEPELVMDTSGYFVRSQYKYTKTEAGKKATQGQQLCVADGVTVAKVDGFSPPAKVGDVEASRATVTLKLRNAMPWVSSEETRAVAPELTAEFTDSVVLLLKDGKWVAADQHALREVALAERKIQAAKQSAESKASSGDGFMSTLKKLFSFSGGNPVIGKWKSQVMGTSMQMFEFTSDSMISSGQKVKVRYEVESTRVTVYPEGAGAGLVIEVVDHDTLSLNMGLMDIKLVRSDK